MKYKVTAQNLPEPIVVSAPNSERAIEKVEHFFGMCLAYPQAEEVVRTLQTAAKNDIESELR